MTLYINHAGYLPHADKRLLIGGLTGSSFEIVRQAQETVAFSARFERTNGDFGLYSAADFSSLTEPGWYYARAERERSLPFRIGSDVYDDALEKIQEYFRLQRCGDSRTGWNGPCHLDDGIRGDTGEHQDVSGGWHDACDLRKWVSATIYGLLGLAWLEPFTPQIEEELRWGNRYFLAMQEPDGYLMDFIGGDYYVHSDNNRWTDNLADGVDDRVIQVRPCDPVAQWAFVLAESLIAQKLRERDPQYSLRCLDAALACAAWMQRSRPRPSTAELGAGISALLALAYASADRLHQELAVSYANNLCALQLKRAVDGFSEVHGFFFEQAESAQPAFEMQPYKDLWRGCWPLYGLTEIIQALPDHPDTAKWQAAVERYIDAWLLPISTRNAFGIVPFGLYRSDPGGDRGLGRFWYRYFYPENDIWYVGSNANLASTALALAKASRLFNRADWLGLAQRQADWILGFNPFNASSVADVGYNHPQHMFGAAFAPSTPFLPGAVINGISGNKLDEPQLRPGSWQDTEYWTPMVAYTLALLSDLRAHS